MCSGATVRPPAWSGLRPGLPDWRPVPDVEARRVAGAVGIEGRVLAMDADGDAAGLFRLEPAGGSPLFVRLAGPERADTVERAEHLAAWLAARGVPAAAPEPGFPRRLPDGGAISAARFVDGARLPATTGAMARLGTALARLHGTLAEHPDREGWAAATDRRLAALNETRTALAAGRIEAGPDPTRLRALAADPEIDFVRAGVPRRPLHGDLNPGNVLAVDGAPVFLDFEDALHSVLPPAFELALALERFVLVPLTDDAAARAAGGKLLAAYRDGGGAGKLDDLAGAMRALAVRSLCVLAMGLDRGEVVPEAEWRKFLELEAQARTRQSVIAAIETRRGGVE